MLCSTNNQNILVTILAYLHIKNMLHVVAVTVVATGVTRIKQITWFAFET